MYDMFHRKTILVVGGTGTIGKKIVEILLGCDPKVIRIFSRDEHKQYLMQNSINQHEKLRFLIGDVRDYERVARASQNVDIIFHLAAMKHVPACEYNPFEAVKTNVLGTQNIIQASVENNIERVVFSSSDKAISPTNAMGATKLLAERLISSANYNQGTERTVFSAVRFGNVMGSRGSVIPLFKSQILEQKKITITNGEMSRFMMSISDAANLTIKAAVNARGGEVFVLKMPIINLRDLGEVVIEETCKKYNIPVGEVKTDLIGLRPGEKMYEELMTEEEAAAAFEMPEMYAILPFLYNESLYNAYKKYKKAEVKTYSSYDKQQITKEEIRKLILQENLL